MLRKIFRAVRQKKFPYRPLVEVTVSRERILHNYAAFQKMMPGVGIAPVLKSNAYGHGLAQIAAILEKERPRLQFPFLIVDSYYEAVILRNEGIASPLLIISYSDDENILKNKLRDVSFTLSSVDQLAALIEALTNASGGSDRKIRFHLKLDTGMSRHGIRPEEFAAAIELIKTATEKSSGIELEGICTHLADSESDDSAFTEKQIADWNAAVDIFKKTFPELRYWHAAATSGAFYQSHLHSQAQTHPHIEQPRIKANMFRLGLGLYGYVLNEARDGKIGVQPALEMRSILSSVKRIRKGDKVGYNGIFEAPRDMSIATIPAGYFEGVDRRLSNCGFVEVIAADGKRITCPIIGKVSMNITTIDISGVFDAAGRPAAKRGDEVVLISRERNAKNSVVSIALFAKTVPWEILVHIPAQLRRTVI